MAALIMIIPLVGVLLLNLPFGKITIKLAPLFGVVCAVGLVALMLCSPTKALTGDAGNFAWLPLVPYFNDSLTFVMLLSIGIVSFATFMVSCGSQRDENHSFVFSNLIILAFIGMIGVVMASDLFTMYVFIEVVAVASYTMIAFERDAAGLEGAFKYLVMSALATVLLLFSLALLFMACGSLKYGVVMDGLKLAAQPQLIKIALVLFVVGGLIKGGVIPFHGWLPDAYSSAPKSASILLAGIVTKTSGIYVLIRVLGSIFQFNYGDAVSTCLLVAGTLSIVGGALAALSQTDFRRMLSYSSISQVGYIILGIGVGTPLGMAGAILHLFNHSIFKSLLFVNAAAVERQTGQRNMDEMGGLASKMPVTGVTSVMGMLSAAGIPPLSGFWSKLIIAIALFKVGSYGYLAIMILASALTLGYFLHMQQRVFFGKIKESLEHVKEAGMWVVIPSVVLALITLGIGLSLPWLFDTILVPIRSILL